MQKRLYLDRYPGLEIVLGLPNGVQHVPAEGREPHPNPGWKSASGLVSREDRRYLWAYYKARDGDVTIEVPFLPADLIPSLGPVAFVQAPEEGLRINFRDKGSRGTTVPVPAPVSSFDFVIVSFDIVPTLDLDLLGIKTAPPPLSRSVLAPRRYSIPCSTAPPMPRRRL